MKLQFKTDEILKKVDALILKDITAKKKLNLAKQETYEKESLKYEDLIQKSKYVLSKYSDKQLIEKFLDCKTVSVEGSWWIGVEEGENYKIKSTWQNLDEISYVTVSEDAYVEVCVGGKILRTIKYGSYRLSNCDVNKLVVERDKLFVLSSKSKPIAPLFQEETPSKELLSLKEKILLAKSYGVEDIILEDEDLEVLKKDYTSCEDTSLKELMVKIHEEMYNRGVFMY